MEWIRAKDAAILVNRSPTIISRFAKKHETSKHVKREGRFVFIDKAFVLSEYPPESTSEIHRVDTSKPTTTTQPTNNEKLNELKATVEFLIELQARTENSHDDLVGEKDQRIADLKRQVDQLMQQVEQQSKQMAQLTERYTQDRHELNTIILEQSRIIAGLPPKIDTPKG